MNGAMSARTLLTELRTLGVELAVEGDGLTVDAPPAVITEDLRSAMVENKPRLLKLLTWEQRKLEEADRRGLVIRWSREPGYISLHDPLTGEWHDVKASECLPGVVGKRQQPEEGSVMLEAADSQLETLIERRSRNGDVTPDELEPSYLESVRRYNARQRREVRAAWYSFFCRMADNHRSLSENYERRAESLQEECGLGGGH